MPHERKVALLVDDDNEFISELQESLALSGYIPVAASNGREALKAAREIRPDVILLDLKLGTENGFRIADKIRKDPATERIPIIMMSGHFNELDHSKLLAPSAVNIYLNKPFSQKDVVLSIQTVLTDQTETSLNLMKRLLLDA
ncbi:MAG: hypothetical protein A2X34_04655 [Elusimicrobia bacterium GWC2_51_8]|nr:MAG: hypothetical protein A2X33_00380 [Elusimicrobia bacterium GWA2_51_34]OGR63653.1 MAG: hypothetical protein A2X34_04655 [Elusimicrobia bacterium GWC2_51_8]OGR84589.1 MAG: hypothetical protein A2021_02535 [Elusimicrobia bacterium GWF2_52_66]HAF96326.1 hypothetical protein [Elusimicrobiota bacterium]HCE98512.1 hypothetical protein [Elusimicrobiota bacterium]